MRIFSVSPDGKQSIVAFIEPGDLFGELAIFESARRDEFAEAAETRFKALGQQVRVKVGDGSRGWPENEPYDRIIVTAAAAEAPQELIDELAPGGRMVIPLGGQDVQVLSVIEKDSGRWLGRIGPWQPEGWPGTEVGWSLVRSAWGQGYAVEAAEAAIDWAFEALGWDEVVHVIAVDNVRSQAVAKRLGSANRGPTRMPEPFHEIEADLWAQSREQWAERRRS